MSQLSGGGREEAEGQGPVLGLGSPPPPYLRQQQSSQEPIDVDVDEEAPIIPAPNQSSQGQGSQGSQSSGLECPICLQSCIHPVELPCHHIFCFLCIKGVVTQGGGQPRCAICRQDIPSNVLTNPMLKDVTQLYKPSISISGFLWYYEARGGGWWEYDERTMQELERSYNDGQASTQLLIAGHLYDINFTQMIQARAGNPNLFRRIKRDIPRTDKKGIAGIRIEQTRNGNNPNPSGAPPTSQGQGHQGGGRRGGRGSRGSHRHQSSSGVSSTLQSVINAVAAGVSGPSILTGSGSGSVPQGMATSALSPTGGNSVTFFIPNPNPPVSSPNSSSNNGSGSDFDSNDPDADIPTTDTDSDAEDDSLDDEEDEDMGFGPEDDSTEEEIDEFDVRDGARAPTSRSDRSTSSSNHNPQTPDPNDPRSRSGSSSGRGGGSRRVSTQSTTPVDGFPYVFSPTPGVATATATSDQHNGIGSPPSSVSATAIPTPTSPTAVNSSTSPNSQSNNNGTCIRVGQNLRILVDDSRSPPDEDEIL